MLNLNLPPLRILLMGSLSVALSPLSGQTADSRGPDIDALRSALIPKREVGAEQFLQEHPTYDGRDVVIAIFDTGVDPAAAGLATTSTGERKVLDMIDASGSGDVDTSAKLTPGEDGTLEGLTGLVLTLPEDLENPSGEFHIGMKPASELFPRAALRRLQDKVKEEWQAELSRLRQAEDRETNEELDAALAKAAEDRTREEQNRVALHDAKTALDDTYAGSGPGLVYDCVVWHDGEHWRVIIDANRNGDLGDDLVLRPYGIAGEYGTFDHDTHATYAVQVYEEGNLLSIVTMSGSHGTHVASIAAGHFPDEPARNGVAPGAQILSIKIGDQRVGGGSYGPSERRAIATAARYGVDIMNASWGGSSTYQNGGDSNSMHYQMLADRFDILAVMSAGNEGPGLSTAGSAGGEASRVLGVGAYASTEMGKALYNTIKDSPDAALQFTSRGPTKDGDNGVDVMAPGAAWASISAETLESAGMYNGTSMAAPSASGVAALVLSAAKQNDMAPRPALMRNAMMLGAAPIEMEAGFTRGAGMAHAPGAWAKLQELQGEPAFDVFYNKAVSGGTFTDTGRGLYLRQPLDELRRRVTANIAPHWPESTDNDARFAFDESFVLKPAADWIEAPEFMHLVNGSERMTLHLNIPEMTDIEKERGGLLMSHVDAFLPGKEELGPVFTVPLTIVRPADPSVFEDHKLKTSLELQPAMTVRRFYAVPSHAEKLRIRIKHTAEDPITRRFFLQVLTLAAEHGQQHYKGELVSWVDEGDEREMLVKVRPGGVTELAFNQYFYSPEATELELELEWLGVGLVPNTLALETNHGYTPVELNPLASGKVGVNAKLTHAEHISLPVSTEEFREDERTARPASPMTPGPTIDPTLRLTYELSFEEPVSGTFGEPQAYDYSEGLLGGRLKAVHESGEVLYNGFPDDKKSIDFPAGTTTVMAEFGSLIPGVLDTVKTMPLRLLVKLENGASLGVLAQERARFHGGSTSSLNLHEGRQQIIFIEDEAVEAANELDPAPDYLSGMLSFTDGDDEIVETRLVYLIGDAPSKVTDQDPEAAGGDDLKTVTESLADSIYDLQLAFVREQRLNDELEIAQKRYNLLDTMMAERPDNPAPYVEKAIEGAILAGLASEFWGSLPEADDTEEAEEEASDEEEATDEVERITKDVPDTEQILAWLDTAEEHADPAGVAQFFGAKPVALPGDIEARDEIAAEEKVWMTQRDALATITRLRADLHRATGDLDLAWKTLAELQRWEAEASEDTLALTATLYEEAGLPGLALEALNARIDEDPYNTELLEQRIALYRELGWERHAEAEERLLAVRAANLARINSL
jgi:tripeptidyl-peptidase-2